VTKVIAQPDTLVLLEDVIKTYRMGEVEVNALNHTDLTIRKGEFVVILGPSGSGKTTLLNMLGGIDTPTSGRIVIDDVDISKATQRELTLFRREKVGFVFQFFNLIPTLNAEENVRFAIQLASRDGKPPSRTAKELLEAVGLGARLRHFPSQLSGGEQQRVAVARALAKDPVMVLGDEPTGNLDFHTGKLVLGALKELNVSEGKTVVIVTHNSPIAQVADRILHLRDGGIAREEIVTNPTPPEEIVW
jgi:putative ABC transport system ATP-binding protein